MKPASILICLKHRGSVLIISMIFVVMFSALVVSMATMAGTNAQIAVNQHKANCARACAESGHQIIRHWLSHTSIPGTTAQELRLSEIANSFQSAADEISNVTLSYDSSSITVPSIILDSDKQKCFSAQITQVDPNELQVDVTGAHSPLSKTIRANYEFAERADTVFDFALASKGPLSLEGNAELEGVNVSVESSVYIESEDSLLALSITGNGIEFYGNAGGIINGSIINYSDGAMSIAGNTELRFNRSGTTHAPAGFVPELILQYDPTSYSETPL